MSEQSTTQVHRNLKHLREMVDELGGAVNQQQTMITTRAEITRQAAVQSTDELARLFVQVRRTLERLTSGSVVATDSLAVGTPVPETCGAKDRTDHRSAALVAASRRTLAGPEMINVPCLGLASRARISFRAARARARCPGSSKLNGTWTMPDRGRSASRRALT